jgi:transcriptional regulator with XRE-family HTH domain
MKGKTVKEILKRNNIALNELAERMGVSPQNLQSMLRAADIKTGTLERIAEATNKSLYFFYKQSQGITGEDYSAILEKEKPISTNESEFLALLKKKDEQIDRLLTLLELKS